METTNPLDVLGNIPDEHKEHILWRLRSGFFFGYSQHVGHSLLLKEANLLQTEDQSLPQAEVRFEIQVTPGTSLLHSNQSIIL